MLQIRLKKARESCGFSQRELARELGVSQGTVGNWESGTRSPSTDMLRKIASVLKVSADYLLERVDEPNERWATQEDIDRFYDNSGVRGKIATNDMADDSNTKPNGITVNNRTYGSTHKQSVNMSDDFVAYAGLNFGDHDFSVMQDEKIKLIKKIENDTITDEELIRFDTIQKFIFEKYDCIFRSPDGKRILDILMNTKNQEQFNKAARVLEALLDESDDRDRFEDSTNED